MIYMYQNIFLQIGFKDTPLRNHSISPEKFDLKMDEILTKSSREDGYT